MAELGYAVTFSEVPFGTSPQSIAAIFNGSGSSRVLRVYKIYVMNAYRGAEIVGGINNMEIRRSSSHSGGSSVTPTAFDTTSESVPAQVLFAYNATVGDAGVFRGFVISSDEISVMAGTSIDEWQTIPALQLIYDSARYSPEIQPMTLREGEGLHVKYAGGTNSLGAVTTVVEFTTDTS